MLHIALYQPEIPPNTGNIIRLCANTGAHLHLIHPLGFEWDNKQLRRAGLDYHEWAEVSHYENWEQFSVLHTKGRIFGFSTKASLCYSQMNYQKEDVLLFGPETRGLPALVRESYCSLRIPMRPTGRSINLSNAVAIVLFEAWRQLQFSYT